MLKKDELIDPSVLERRNYCQGRPYKPDNQAAFDLCPLNQWPVTE